MEAVAFEELELRPEQRKTVDHVCRVMGEHLDMNEAPLRGFFWKALREWQEDRGLPTSAMREMTPPERLEAAEQIGVFFRGMLRKYLSDDHRDKIDAAWAAAMKTYAETYAPN